MAPPPPTSVADSGFVTPGLSHVRGPTDTPLLTSTIYGTFRAQAARLQERLALVVHDVGLRWSWSELLRRTDAAAVGLSGLGVEKGDRVAVWMQNCSEWLVMQLATAKLGAVMVNINPDYRLPELEFALNLVGCKALVMAPRSQFLDYTAMVQELFPELSAPGAVGAPLACRRAPALRRVVLAGGAMPGALPFDDLYKDGAAAAELAASCSEPVNIQFTSGTTGRPKATMLTHRNILNNGYFVGKTMNYTEEDTVCVPVPLYHCFGCVMGNMAMVAHGCALVYPTARFNPLVTLQATVEHRCTSLYGVPTMFIAMLEHPQFQEFKFEVLRTGIMAGALCPVDTMNKVISLMGAREVTVCYGMTETSPVSWQTRIGTPVDLACSTVGQIHPHAECVVVHPDTLEVVPCDTPGELWTAGYLVMEGYWENQEATDETIVVRDGKRWMRTGDLAVITQAGFCQIVGRIKDMILRGGENIFPKELEELLIAHPDISNASVIGVPDSRLGEQVCAWVAWRGGAPTGQAAGEAERTVRAYLEDKVAYYKLPKYIVFKDEFPLTVSGKIRKVEMREISTRELGLEQPVPRARL